MMYKIWKARALLVNAFSEATAYRVEVVIWLISGFLPLIMMFIWMGLAESGPMGDYSAKNFATYFLMVFFVTQTVEVSTIQDLNSDIRLGYMSFKLLLPLNPYWMYMTANLGDLVVRLPLLVPFTLAGFYIVGALSDLSILSVLAFIPALVAAWLIHFNMSFNLGLLAFWIDKADVTHELLYTLQLILGGALAPLALFPKVLLSVLAYTPFPYVIDFPINVILGLHGVELVEGFIIQIFWVVVLTALYRLLWRKGLQKYSAVGS
ncbi:multidrug ABC transporter permease [Dulcicalothrix desertica PCC 7102]|uniref:Multidrug ABC transporter permease n=1 Tax=Dulcicalothrix desertica PCC 7102 TaxID=232991 RepID=A0A433UN83_9CYAN|nr:ABC-2 family transporter protein [Dulcicalothrix desertica]RUS95295.1 multidrug ABC transporter permease [Dulcicalothrix desertica PCC 7102]TWH43983.1 ABC-2 type transport system permease protein [Dulcicalothrix desertica PCC 7102]